MLFDTAVRPPLLLINFDLNLTVVLKDSSKDADEEYMLISVLSENTFAKWDENSEKMSFKEYAYSVMVPGDKSNIQIKKERQKVISTFFQWLEEKQHPALPGVMKDYQEIKDKFTDKADGKLRFTVFPSFYRMLVKLREMRIPYTILLRTFGKDLPEVVKEIEEHPHGFKISNWGHFEKGSLNIVDRGVFEKHEAIFDIFLNARGHFAIRDDYKTWNDDGEKGRSGKPFLFDQSGMRKGIKNLSLFFDDNFTGEELDIVKPCEISCKEVSTSEMRERIAFTVNTKEAMLNDDYFIQRVMKALESI